MKLHAASRFPAHSTKMLQGNMPSTGVFIENQSGDRQPDLQAHVYLHALMLRGT